MTPCISDSWALTTPCRLCAVFALAVLVVMSGCARRHDDRVVITYWEKWTGQEAAAMQKVVEAFNASQDRIYVEYLAVSGIDRKIILAAAGGDPPDVAGIWPRFSASWADMNALTPFDEYIEADGSKVDEYIGRYEKGYAEMCMYDGKVYCLPATPSAVALHWNKTLFREAGLNPERPPQTIEELMEYSRKLTKRDPKTGRLTQVGFLPQDPGWWPWTFPAYFGGELMDDEGNITLATNPKNIESMEWALSYTDEYGLDDVNVFASGFGRFGSPQYPFFAGKVAIILQGVWLNNYIRLYSPGLDYGVGPWPKATDDEAPFTMVEFDALVIPRGAKHPREAWEFIKYVNSSNPNAQTFEELQGIELLCFLQEKNSPLKEWSPYFLNHHPHPHISVFRELARSPRSYHVLLMGVFQEYERETIVAFDRIRLKQATPKQALEEAHSRVDAAWQRHKRSLQRHTRADEDS